MIELVKKAMFTGAGLAALTTEKARDFAREMANQLQLTGDKGKQFIDDVVAESDKARKGLEENVQKYVADSLHRMKISTQDDIEKLCARIEQLEKTIAEKLP